MHVTMTCNGTNKFQQLNQLLISQYRKHDYVKSASVGIVHYYIFISLNQLFMHLLDKCHKQVTMRSKIFAK